MKTLALFFAVCVIFFSHVLPASSEEQRITPEELAGLNFSGDWWCVARNSMHVNGNPSSPEILKVNSSKKLLKIRYSNSDYRNDQWPGWETKANSANIDAEYLSRKDEARGNIFEMVFIPPWDIYRRPITINFFKKEGKWGAEGRGSTIGGRVAYIEMHCQQ